ncbi:MAG: MATE family efflux transporter [Paludibacteraceae bacterium]|nr:MATE family efflux transporter [Paludibacteraceae bacterium]
MRIQLSDHYGYRKLFRFTLPSILMILFTSIYGVVDGLFISNYVGTTAFAAVNLIMPLLMITGSVGYMIGSGGSALVAKIMGEGDDARANRLFTMMVWLSVILGVILNGITYFLLRPVSILFGATGPMLEYCVRYGTVIVFGGTFFILQFVFQPFFVAAEQPRLGMWVTIAAGVTNIIGDFVLVGLLHYGLVGAAMASNFSQVVGSVIPIIYFRGRNNSRIHLTTAEWDFKAILHTFSNGASEMVTNVSLSLVNILYNVKLLSLAGQNGVAAYGIIMYASYMFVSVYLGYAMGVMPVVGFHYGAGNRDELRSLLRHSCVILTLLGILFTTLAEIFAYPIAGVFVGYDPELHTFATHAFRLYMLAFVVSPFNIFASSFFTALNNGYVSATISFTRLFLFQIGAILILPIFFGVDGIWSAIIASEVLSLLVVTYFFLTRRSRYGYF